MYHAWKSLRLGGASKKIKLEFTQKKKKGIAVENCVALHRIVFSKRGWNHQTLN